MTSTDLKIIRNIEDLRSQTSAWREDRETIVLVPTMGALHAGHMTLFEYTKSVGTHVIASVFVNPLQFGPNEDFARYPRDLDADVAILRAAGVDVLWLPDHDIMYPPGFTTKITIGDLDNVLCGAYRPGHFSGVATVVTKLLNQTAAKIAVFGEKDFQQLHIIRKMVRELDLPVDIHGVPTSRESSGLARSSRNRYLSSHELAIAPKLHGTLNEVAEHIQAGHNVTTALANGITSLEKAGFSPVQYLELRDALTLEPIGRLERDARLLVAAYLGQTRLIDNIAVTPYR